MERFLPIDLHMHSTVSDGTDSPAELLRRVRELGLGLFSLTDHDAVSGCREIASLLRPGDPLFLTGVEFSCRDEEGRYHILGYGSDPDSPDIKALVDAGHGLRIRKVRARLARLEDEYGFSFPPDETAALFRLDNPGKPHIARLMVKHGFSRTIGEAITNYIDRLHLVSEHIRPEAAVSAVIAAGGIPVLAHPVFGDGRQFVAGDALEARILRLADMGLAGVEAYYSGFAPELCREVVSIAERHSLLITAGSDYHGANKSVPLGNTGLRADESPPDGLIRFLKEAGTRLVR